MALLTVYFDTHREVRHDEILLDSTCCRQIMDIISPSPTPARAKSTFCSQRPLRVYFCALWSGTV